MRLRGCGDAGEWKMQWKWVHSERGGRGGGHDWWIILWLCGEESEMWRYLFNGIFF